MIRGLYRTVVLLASDMAAFGFLALLVRGFGDEAWAGATFARAIRILIPAGTFAPVESVCAVVLGLFLLGCYKPSDRRRDPRALTAGATLGLALVFWHTFWMAFTWPGTLGFVLAAAVVVGTIVVERAMLDMLVRWLRPINDLAGRVLIVASAAEAREARSNLALSNPGEFCVVGFLDTQPHPSRDALGGLGDLVPVIDRHHIDTVVFYGQVDELSLARMINLSDAAGCHVLCIPSAFTLRGFQPQLTWHSGEPMVQVTRPSMRGRHMLVKSGVDFGASLVGLVLLAPLIAAVAAAVKLSSPGPVLFAQERVGRGGRRFRMLKFRSMIRDAEARRADLAADSVYGDQRLFKIKNDPRVTRLGAFLRRTSLDELPQLVNVLRGEMSLVGPRPPLPCEVALYEDRHYLRLDMKPGITGPWQVGGRNNITDFEEVVRLEESYIRHWSIWKDVVILVRTFPVVFRMDGAH